MIILGKISELEQGTTCAEENVRKWCWELWNGQLQYNSTVQISLKWQEDDFKVILFWLRIDKSALKLVSVLNLSWQDLWIHFRSIYGRQWKYRYFPVNNIDINIDIKELFNSSGDVFRFLTRVKITHWHCWKARLLRIEYWRVENVHLPKTAESEAED